MSNSVPQGLTAFYSALQSACIKSDADRPGKSVTESLQVLEILLVSRTTEASRGCCQGPNTFETHTLSTTEGSEGVDSSKGAYISSNQRADATSQIASLDAEPCRNCLELVTTKHERCWQCNHCSSVPLRIELNDCRLALRRDYDCDVA